MAGLTIADFLHSRGLRPRCQLQVRQCAYNVDHERLLIFVRSFTVDQAKSLGVTGFVKNSSDGTVCVTGISCENSADST